MRPVFPPDLERLAARQFATSNAAKSRQIAQFLRTVQVMVNAPIAVHLHPGLDVPAAIDAVATDAKAGEIASREDTGDG